jgi:hypothetical protein
MPSWNLSDLSKLPAGIQAQIYPKGYVAPAAAVESPGGPREPVKHIDKNPNPELTALDRTPVHVPAEIIRHILNNYGAARL